MCLKLNVHYINKINRSKTTPDVRVAAVRQAILLDLTMDEPDQQPAVPQASQMNGTLSAEDDIKADVTLQQPNFETLDEGNTAEEIARSISLNNFKYERKTKIGAGGFGDVHHELLLQQRKQKEEDSSKKTEEGRQKTEE